ncbi:MAG: F0F1 ATP synthase subunit delta [Methylococcaceae bacterium]|nr:F0F1 ATP synthase subunit delta [Methylococcaceae bacterium]
MSEIATLARPYAVAAFKRAKDGGTAEKWSKSLAFMSAVLRDQDIVGIVNNPKVGKNRLSALMLDICEGQVDQEGSNFLKLLVQNSRLALLPAIASIFESLKADDEGYIEVEVLTAYAFTDEARQSFSAKLAKTMNKNIHMNVTVDTSLIGGVLVRAGDKVIDGSIRGQLQQMQRALQ